MTRTDIWNIAILWTKSHGVLIRCVAAPYRPYMGCSAHDIEGEALLTAYLTLRGLLDSEKDLSLMDRYFRVVFRSRCIHMTLGIKVAHGLDIEQIRIPLDKEQPLDPALDQQLIETALRSLTRRQRQVAQWILHQETPASVDLIGQHFGITARGVRRLINTAIDRIEHGHHRVCPAVSAHT